MAIYHVWQYMNNEMECKFLSIKGDNLDIIMTSLLF
jgi:hypothetical protein